MTTRRPDSIHWKQIGTGYLIVGCILGGTLMALARPSQPGDQGINTLVGFVFLAVCYGLYRLLLRPLGAWILRAFAPSEEGLKRAAVAALCVFSVVTSGVGALVAWRINY